MITNLNLRKDLFRLAGVTSTSTRSDVTVAVNTSISRAQKEFMNYGDWGFLQQYQGNVYIPIVAVYSTGYVSVTSGSQTITGTGTTWTADMVGRYFRVSDQETYEIQAFVSTTSLTLQIPYQGTTNVAGTATYEIMKRFYALPLNYHSIVTDTAKVQQVGSNAEYSMSYRKGVSFRNMFTLAQPLWFAIEGNTRGADYFNTGTVTVATTAGVSTWTISSGTLPTDIVNREVRILGEEAGYLINARTGATTFTTLVTYFNPSDATSVATTATYAITPKETLLMGVGAMPGSAFSYIFSMAYAKKIPDLISDTDVSPISQAGYDSEFIAVARWKFAEDYRTMVKSNNDTSLIVSAGVKALGEAWASEQQHQTMQEQSAGFVRPPDQPGPSWLG